MPILAIGQFLRQTIWTQKGNQAGLMVHHWRVSAVVAPAPTDQEAVADLSTIIAPSIKGLLAAEASYLGSILSVVFPANLAPVFSTVGAGVGTVAGEPLPTQVAGLITLRSAVAGRMGRGRKYVPFPGEADNVTGDGPTAGYVVRLNTLASNLTTQRTVASLGGGSAVLIPVIFRRALPNLSNDVNAFTSRTKWATQRRRGAFGRPNVAPF